MNISNNIITPAEAVQKQGAKVLIYGMSGAGKTYSIKTCPGRVLVISAEAGLLSIKDATNVSVIEVNTAEGVHRAYKELNQGSLKGQFDTVCLDSISEISELLLIAEKAKHKDPRMAYGQVQDTVKRLMRDFRDLEMHVVFLCKEDKVNNDGVFESCPKLVGTKLGQEAPHYFDEVLALRVIDDTDADGNRIQARWFQTRVGNGYIAKDRSQKLDDFEEPNLTKLIEKLGFELTSQPVQPTPQEVTA